MASGKGAATNVESVDDSGWETLVEEFGENWIPENVGDELTGIYTGSKMVEQTDLKSGEIREVALYDVTDTNGKKWAVWSSYNIDLGFASCGVGDSVKIVYMGTDSLDGGRSVKKFRFFRKSR